MGNAQVSGLSGGEDAVTLASSGTRRFRPILSGRGLLIALFATYLLAGPAAYESDIIATVVALSLFTLLGLVIALTTVKGVTTRNSLQVALSTSLTGDTATLTADVATPLVIRISPLTVPPFYHLELSLEFEQPGTDICLHIVQGEGAEGHTLVHPLVFPHRGVWNIRTIRAKLSDRAGLSQYGWSNIPIIGTRSFLVAPPIPLVTQVPPISSTQRTGDEISITHERAGDPYELKPYHPSDGLRKVVWKVFARTGELISRHPEPSMSPEGRTLLFVAANRDDDRVAGRALAYVAALERLDLEVFTGCEGLEDRDLAHGFERSRDLLCECVWATSSSDSAPTLESDWLRTVAGAQQAFGSSHLSRVIMFVSGIRLQSRSYQDAIIAVGRLAARSGIRPTVVVVYPVIQPVPSTKSALHGALRTWFTTIPSDTPRHDPAAIPLFLSLCAHEGWEVLSEADT